MKLIFSKNIIYISTPKLCEYIKFNFFAKTQFNVVSGYVLCLKKTVNKKTNQFKKICK